MEGLKMTRQQFIKYLIKCKAIQFYVMDDGPLKGMVMISSEYFFNDITSISLQPSDVTIDENQSEFDKMVDIISASIDYNIEKGIIALIFDIRLTDPKEYEPYRIYNKKEGCYIKNQHQDAETFIDEEDAYDYLIKNINYELLYNKYKYEIDINTKIRKVQDDYLIDITEETKGIFGDDVKKVEVTFLYDYDDLSEAELQEEILSHACDVLNDLFLKPSCVYFGGENLYITFHSGNQVKITNSEWADISKA